MTYMLVAFLVYLVPFLIAAGVIFFVIVAPALASSAAGSLPKAPPLPTLANSPLHSGEKDLHLGLPVPTVSR